MTMAQSASKTFTASSRPPRPTSRMTTSSACCAEHLPRRQRAEFEIGQGRTSRPPRPPRPARTPRHSAASSTGAAGDAHALVVAQQVRRGVEADAIAGAQQDALEHGAGRTLAIGAADGDDRDSSASCPSACLDALHAIQSELDGRGMLTRSMYASQSASESGMTYREPRQAAWAGMRCSRVSSEASWSRIWRRSTIMSIAPFSSRNSARWKPSGSVSRTVCSITRGAGEADQRAGFGDHHVAHEGEAGGHAAHGRDRSAPR